jgi:hypothetical protein
MKDNPNIPMGVDGLPDCFKRWSPDIQKCWLERNVHEPFRKKHGYDLRLEILQRLEIELMKARILQKVKGKIFPSYFNFDVEAKILNAMQNYLRRKRAPAARPIVRVAPQEGVRESTRAAAERELSRAATMRRK